MEPELVLELAWDGSKWSGSNNVRHLIVCHRMNILPSLYGSGSYQNLKTLSPKFKKYRYLKIKIP